MIAAVVDTFGRRRAVLLASQSDERLVALARDGHERAFTAIVERYRPELSAFARRLSSDGNSEDVLQQAFLGAFAALRAGAEVKHLRGWLYRIVRNAAARTRTPAYVPLDGAIASSEDVEDIVEQRALALETLAELSRLPSRQRQAIVGTALDGRARAEVASAMGLSEGAVRQLIHRARGKLRGVITAVTPWPLARWIAGACTGGGSPVEVVAGAGAGVASTGGFVGLKLGVVLASGAIATGVAAVDIHGSHRAAAPSPTARAVTSAHHAHAARRAVHAVVLAAVDPATALAPAAAAPSTPVASRAPAAARPSRTTSTPVAMRRLEVAPHRGQTAVRRPVTTVRRPEPVVRRPEPVARPPEPVGHSPEAGGGATQRTAAGGAEQPTAEQPVGRDGGGTDASVADAVRSRPDGGWYGGGSGSAGGTAGADGTAGYGGSGGSGGGYGGSGGSGGGYGGSGGSGGGHGGSGGSGGGYGGSGGYGGGYGGSGGYGGGYGGSGGYGGGGGDGGGSGSTSSSCCAP